MEPIELYKTRDMGQVLQTSVSILKLHYKPLFKLFAIICLPIYLAGNTLISLSSTRLIGSVAEEARTGTSIANPLDNLTDLFTSSNFLLGFVLLLLTSFTISWVSVYFMKNLAGDAENNTEPSDIWTQILDSGWKLIPASLLFGFLFGIAMLVSMLISFFTLVLIPVWYVFFLFSMVLLFLFPPVYLIEEEGLFSSLERIFRLLKKRWLRGFGLLIVSLIVVSVITVIPSLLLGLVSAFNPFDIQAQAQMSGTLTGLLLSNLLGILGLFGYLVMGIIFTVFYYSLVEEKDQVMLRKKIENIGEEGEENGI